MKKKILLLVGTALLFFAVTSMAQVKNAKQKIISNIDREQFIETYSHTGGVMVDGMSVYIEKNKLNISLSSGNNQKLIYKEISIKETIKNEKYIVTAICNISTVPFTFYKRKGIY
ncbi:MAG: hypothetical protein NTU73_05345, partial [Ignavibacteriae bacterium]|nr:hypothetical protein [Ignavibacteriota bacterium]